MRSGSRKPQLYRYPEDILCFKSLICWLIEGSGSSVQIVTDPNSDARPQHTNPEHWFEYRYRYQDRTILLLDAIVACFSLSLNTIFCTYLVSRSYLSGILFVRWNIQYSYSIFWITFLLVDRPEWVTCCFTGCSRSWMSTPMDSSASRFARFCFKKLAPKK